MPEPETVIAAKRQLREQAKARRSALPPDVRRDGALRLAAHGLAPLGIHPPAVVTAFLAIGDELDPGPLLERLHGEGFALALPVMVGKGQPLLFRAWQAGDRLVDRMWGIREPTADAKTVEPDVLLMPLLAFDRSGYRLGYGGGFYDRTLAGLRARRAVRAIGLAFAAQEVDAVPHLDYDQRLDLILTPDGPISCQR
jgi:5-formyltetrahydrofolate cyclo-ligase